MPAPSKLTAENRIKLQEAAALDASVEEMAYYCGVSKVTIYNWFKEDEKLFNEIERLRQKPILAARQAAVKKSTETYQNAMDFLKRKRVKEFGDKQDFTSGGEKINFVLSSEVANKNGINTETESDS